MSDYRSFRKREIGICGKSCMPPCSKRGDSSEGIYGDHGMGKRRGQGTDWAASKTAGRQGICDGGISAWAEKPGNTACRPQNRAGRSFAGMSVQFAGQSDVFGGNGQEGGCGGNSVSGKNGGKAVLPHSHCYG